MKIGTSILRATLVALTIGAAASIANAHECLTPREWQPRLRNTPYDRNGNFIHDTLDELPPSDEVRIVVDLNRCPLGNDLERLRRFGRIEHVGKWVSTVVLDQVSVAALAELIEDDVVAFIEQDRPFEDRHFMLDISTRALKVRPSLAYSPNTVVDQYPGVVGTGVNIAILDSGVDENHESFTGKFVAGSDCGLNPCVDGNPADTVGHGTHVAGIALGTGGLAAVNQGVAPGAGLIDIKLDGPNPFWSNVLRAIDKVLDRRVAWGIGVVNMSIGDCTATNGTDAVSMATNRMVEEGIIVAVAAGNCSNCSLPANCSIVMAPAAADRAISVANGNDLATVNRADDVLNTGSVQGPRNSDGDGDTSDERKPDLGAPGTTIKSAANGTINSYVDKSGTSMASPHVAGCAALLKQVVPTITPLSARSLLIATSEDKAAAGWDAGWGAGLMDCFRAVDELQQASKTDLGYLQGCGGMGPPCWLHPSLYPSNPSIVEGVPNTINAEIKNLGLGASQPFTVKLSVYNFSNGDLTYDICTSNVPGLAPGGSTVVSCAWTPTISGTPPGTVHACLKSQVIYAYDANFSNNGAQHNINITQTASPARLAMEVVNKTELPLTMLLEPEFACEDRECPGWSVRTSANGIPMAPDDCPRNVDIDLNPDDPAAVREAAVRIRVVGVDPQGRRLDQGGVEMRARIGCLVQKLRYPIPGDKATLSWEPDSFYMNCPRVFDVVRGRLPIKPWGTQVLRGDFSNVECLANDWQEIVFADPSTPNPGRGVFYLVRAGSALPGSYDDSSGFSQVGSRNDTMGGCP